MKRLKYLLLFICMMFILPISVNADSKVKFSVTKSADSVKPNGVFTVKVNSTGASSTDTLDGYKLKITYEISKLEFVGNVSGRSSVNNDNGVITITSPSSFELYDSEDNIASFDMKVLGSASAGSTNLNVSIDECTINGEVDSSKKKCEANAASVKIEALGKDATLSSLKIPNATLTPAFNKDVISYTSKISDVTELSVNAVPTDSNARVEITDNYKNLQKGDNKIQVVVTSEDGNNSKTYTINVNLSLTPTEEELVKSDATLKQLEIKNQKIDFDTNEKKYYLTVDFETKSLEITATPTNENAKVTIEGNKKLIVGKNTVNINVVSEDDSKTETYQILVTRKDQEKEVIKTCPDETSKREWIIFSVSMLVIFTLGIVLGYILGRLNLLGKIFKKKPKEEPVPAEELSDTINLGDELVDLSEAINQGNSINDTTENNNVNKE